MHHADSQPHAGRLQVKHLELQLLRYLCQPRSNSGARQEVLDRLRDYRFSETNCQALFDCLKDVPASRVALLEALLPARLVRAGFPDFDLDPYLRPSGLSAAEARTLCRRLAAKSG